MTESAIERLAWRCGVVREYWQIDGTHKPCSAETAAALLHAMGIAPANDEDAEERLAALDAEEAARPVPSVLLVTADRESRHSLPQWTLVLEAGEEIACDADAPGTLPPLPVGVHELRFAGHRTLVIASPPQAPSVSDLVGQPRAWGLWTSLYGLRSSRNAGIGDYEDLARLAETLARAGASFVGINPVHANGVADMGISPYSPSSRTALDTGYIALDRIPELSRCPSARTLLDGAESKFAAARSSELVDREPRRAVAEEILRKLFETFRAGPGDDRRAAFEAWRASRDPEEARQSVFEALSLLHGADWRQWPEELQDADGEAARTFVAGNASEILYHDWRQWIAETQLGDAQRRARAAGMGLGLYLDIAVGVRPGGAETWTRRNVFATGVSLGAPPDLLNSRGQAWNLSAFSPIGLAAQDYQPFRRMLRSTMAKAGLVRIDHVIGLRRSYWIPENGAPGGYVAFPTDILLALIRIEAHRARCMVVGEDLGTVPEGLREAMAETGLLGCSILPFERTADEFTPPWEYRPRSLASFGSHDLPTLAGWWAGRDIEVRRELGYLEPSEAEASHEERRMDRIRLCRLLKDAQLLPTEVDAGRPPHVLDAALRDAIHALIAGGHADLVALGLDDLLLTIDQQNVPGTIDEAPNWRRRAARAIEDLGDSPEMAQTRRIMAATGRSEAT